METLEVLIEKAKQSILDGDEDLAVVVAKRAIEANIDLVEVINKGFTVGMAVIGDRFDREEIPLPYVLVAAEVMANALEVLGPHLTTDAQLERSGKIVIGTIEGDIHDIGKRIVATMLRVTGFEVTDLGRDVPVEDFLQAAKSTEADIVASSTLMTTTMAGQRRLQEELVTSGFGARVKTMVGGAAVTQDWADRIGASAYAENASEAARKAAELMV